MRTLPTHVLDLIVAEQAKTEAVESVPSEDRLMPPSGAGIASHGPREQLPLELTLTSLDRTGYRAGDDLLFELLIRNIGQRPFSFPASLDGRRFRRGMPGATVGTVALAFRDDQLSSQLVGLQILYGADVVPGSLISVQPGETLSIRAGGKWLLHGSVPAGLVRDIKLRAQLDIYRANQIYHPLVISANTLQVRLESR